MATLTIAEAAEAAGTSTDTIRYYDREGLLAGLARDTVGNRRFTTDDVGWLRVLRCLRDTGMTMADLRSFCAVDGEVRPADRLAMLVAHRDRVLDRIRRTHEQLAVIDGKIEAYRMSAAGTRAPEVTPVTPAATAARRLGRSDLATSALGVGTWVLGGPFSMQGRPVGWGEVDDEESVRVLRRAVDLGVTLVDTADVYGTGHAERIVARALGERRDDVVYATKWGNTYDEDARELTGSDPTPQYARRALEASLRRLGTDRIDVWQLHPGDLDPALADDLVALCEDLVDEGSIRTYGWSTDDPARAARFAAGPRCALVQCTLNLFEPAPAILTTARDHDLGVLARSPLAMGLLSDRVTAGTRLAPGDVRHTSPEWLAWFRNGRPTPEYLARRDAVRDVLTSGGRTVAQGALAWLWAHDGRIVPIPGCRTVAQAEENAGALGHGPLTPEQYAEVERLLGRGAP